MPGILSGSNFGNEPTSHVGSPLYVIAVISNAGRYHSRYTNYYRFREELNRQPVVTYVVELAHGDRPFMVTSPRLTGDIQLRTRTEIWHKENLINIGIQALPMDWKYVAWIDADVSFMNPDWVKETLDMLQHHNFIQLWQSCADLGPNGETIQLHKSFCYQHSIGQSRRHGYEFWHPGFAWAARREAIDGMGGLMVSPAVLGAADHHMALGLINEANESYPGQIHPNYKKMVLDWQSLAQEVIKQDIGYVKGTILHHWHGKKKDRRYQSRWNILVQNKFNPLTDVRWDSQGLMTLDPKKTRLRDDIRSYFRARNEDSIDLE